MSYRLRLVRAAVPAGAALVLLAWAAQAQQEPLTAKPFTQPEFVESPCPWPDRAHGAYIDCGYLSVPEDRAKPGGNVIRLAVARLRGSVPSPYPDPVIYLAGGPGENAVQRTHRFVHHARFIWEERDLIVLDQRGVGRSEPLLECPDYQGRKAELRKLDLDPDEARRREVDALLACKRTLSEEGIDVSAYSPQAVAADVADLAAAMGYETYNLYGRGFGTMLALTVMRDFPENVRGVILDGVWPPQATAAEARHANAASALQTLFRRCEADPDCAQRYPDLEQDLWQVVDRYEVQPTTLWRFDHDSSEHFEEEVDGHFILSRVLESLRSRSLSGHAWIPYVPFLLHEIRGGDWEVAQAFIEPSSSWWTSVDNSAAWAALLCHAEGRFTDLSGVLADRAAFPRMVDPDAPDLVPALCAAWHDPTVELMDKTPVASDIPTLLLSGELDPDTPPRWADAAAETLRRSHSVVVPMAGPGVGMDTPCGRALIGAFLNSPRADPPAACSPTADRQSSGFRTIYLKPAARMPRPIVLFHDLVHDVPIGDLLALGVLLILALHVSALILWPVAAVIRRVGSGSEAGARQVGHSRLTAAAIIVISMGFSVSVGAATEFLHAFWELASQPVPWLVVTTLNGPDDLKWLTDEVARNFGFYPWVRPLFVIPYLTAAATLFVLYLAFRSWREKWWTRLGRVHYSIVAVTLAWYPFHMVYAGFIP